MGPDGKHPQVLRELADVIARPLSIIFAQSWRLGEVPEGWRKENVTPVFKTGKKEEPGNYRLVNLTSIPEEGDGAAHPGNHFQTHEGQETPQE